MSHLLGRGQTYLVGLEDDPEGGVRVYFGSRHLNLHSHLDDPETIAYLRREWANVTAHVLIPTPPREAWCGCQPNTLPAPSGAGITEGE